MKQQVAYTMGNKKSYDNAFDQFKSGEIPELKKIGRADLDGEYYSGGCCWPTYEEARAYVEQNKDDIPYQAHIYGILLPNSWEEDTSDDTYKDEGFHSLLVDSQLVMVDGDGNAR